MHRMHAQFIIAVGSKPCSKTVLKRKHWMTIEWNVTHSSQQIFNNCFRHSTIDGAIWSKWICFKNQTEIFCTEFCDSLSVSYVNYSADFSEISRNYTFSAYRSSSTRQHQSTLSIKPTGTTAISTHKSEQSQKHSINFWNLSFIL